MSNILDVGYRRTFKEIFEDSDIFINGFKTTPFYDTSIALTLNDTTLELIFVLLYNRYGNSEIINNSENQFKSKMYGIIWAYAPVWKQKLNIQEKLRTLGLDSTSEIYKGSKAIYNHASNPETSPSTVDTEELEYVNDQNVTKYKKSVLEGLAMYAESLNDRFTDDFINKFRKLFNMFVKPSLHPTFVTEEA